MDRAHVLVVADNAQTGEDLTTRLLPEAGYDVTLADADTRPPEDVDAVLVDVDRVLVSPLTGLQAQRRMGCQAPALLLAPRLNEEMASQILELNIRDFLTKPADEGEILERVRNLLQFSHSERAQQETAERIRQHDEMLRRRLEETETLSAIARSLTIVDNLDTVLARIVDAGVYLTHAEEGALFMADEVGKLYVRAEKNLGEREVHVLSALSEDSTAMLVYQTGEAVMRSGEESELKVKTGYFVKALINVPIVVGSTIVGVLAVYNHSQKPFQPTDISTLTALSDYAALALSRAEAVAALQRQVLDASEASRKVFFHTNTMDSPIESIEAQVESLLHGTPGPINEAQSDSLNRIKLSLTRLKEIERYVRELAEDFAAEEHP